MKTVFFSLHNFASVNKPCTFYAVCCFQSSNNYISLSQVLGIVMMFDCVPGCKSSAMEEAFSRNMLASFLLVREIVAPTLAHVCCLHTYDESCLDRATGHQFSECVQANVLTGLVNFYQLHRSQL